MEIFSSSPKVSEKKRKGESKSLLHCGVQKRILIPEDETYFSITWRVRFVEEGPNFGLQSLPPGKSIINVVFFEAEFSRDFLITRLVRVQVQSVENGQSFLRVSVLSVSHPATRFNLRGKTMGDEASVAKEKGQGSLGWMCREDHSISESARGSFWQSKYALW